LICISLGGIAFTQAQTAEPKSLNQTLKLSKHTPSRVLLRESTDVSIKQRLQSERITLRVVERRTAVLENASQVASQEQQHKVIYLTKEDLNQHRASKESIKAALNKQHIKRARIDDRN